MGNQIENITSFYYYYWAVNKNKSSRSQKLKINERKLFFVCRLFCFCYPSDGIRHVNAMRIDRLLVFFRLFNHSTWTNRQQLPSMSHFVDMRCIYSTNEQIKKQNRQLASKHKIWRRKLLFFRLWLVNQFNCKMIKRKHLTEIAEK